MLSLKKKRVDFGLFICLGLISLKIEFIGVVPNCESRLHILTVMKFVMEHNISDNFDFSD